MAAITYGLARDRAASGAKRARAAAPRRGRFVRFIDALVESRLQSAHREIVKYAHLLPRQDRDTRFGG